MVDYRNTGRWLRNAAFYATENGNTVDANGVVTEATGADLTGPFKPLLEPSATNRITYSDDLSNAAWTKTSCTATYNQIGIAGAANAASLITATGANATVIRASALTQASGEHAFAVNIKRSVGTGTVELTLDNGSTWQDITSQIGASYARIAVDQTLANPQVGIRIVTSGDAVIVGNTGVYYSTSKEVAAVSSPIKTTTAAVTRAADAIDYDDAAIIADNETQHLDHAAQHWRTGAGGRG